MNKTKIIEVKVAKLKKADWNYKSNGTPEQISKLAASIKQDGSAGVLAVRELKGNTLEVIDGNHRVDALIEAKWDSVAVENFGKISKAQAILIARRRNHVWFEDDLVKFATLFKNDVLSEFSITDLAAFMPNSQEELEALSKLVDFDWDNLSRGEGAAKNQKDNPLLIQLLLDERTAQLWQKWVEYCFGKLKLTTHADAFTKSVEAAVKTIKK